MRRLGNIKACGVRFCRKADDVRSPVATDPDYGEAGGLRFRILHAQAGRLSVALERPLRAPVPQILYRIRLGLTAGESGRAQRRVSRSSGMRPSHRSRRRARYRSSRVAVACSARWDRGPDSGIEGYSPSPLSATSAMEKSSRDEHVLRGRAPCRGRLSRGPQGGG